MVIKAYKICLCYYVIIFPLILWLGLEILIFVSKWSVESVLDMYGLTIIELLSKINIWSEQDFDVLIIYGKYIPDVIL